MFRTTRGINRQAAKALTNPADNLEWLHNNYKKFYSDNLQLLFDMNVLVGSQKKELILFYPELVLNSKETSDDFKLGLVLILKKHALIKALDILSIYFSLIWMVIGLNIQSEVKSAGNVFCWIFLVGLFAPLIIGFSLSSIYRKKDKVRIKELCNQHIKS